jgi:uncharacterized protein YjiK
LTNQSINNCVSFPVFLILFAALISCNSKDGNQAKQYLSFSKAHEIPVIEPSGLDLTFLEDGFWAVSDENNTVYKLDNWGKAVKSFQVNGNDLEGIAVVDEKTIAVVLERSREVVIIDTSGKELKRKTLNLNGELNKGLEGITYDPEQKKFYIVNEKKPTLLLTLDENLIEISRDTLNFIKDASGIYFDVRNHLLWILSDESQLVAKCDLEGNPLKKYHISIVQPEGITINAEGKKMYIVSDWNKALYVYELN